MPADSQPWTTSRCNRLLRPISSRIATLRKELDKQSRVIDEARKASGSSARISSPRKANASQPPRCRKPQGLDPDWVPSAKPAGGCKRTYGRRTAKKSNAGRRGVAQLGAVALPGEIAFTPLNPRSGNRFKESPQLHSSPLKGRGQGPLVAKLAQIKNLKKQMPPDIGKLIEGLLDAYAKLLQATHLSEPKSRKGARSLMSTCLQRIPGYIELEEYFAELDKEDADEDEDRDISDEIYTHLEQTYEVGAGYGWRPFKEIVRAHGTSLICDAFADEVLGLESLEIIVQLCMKLSAWPEAEKLLWTFLPNLRPLSTPSNLRTSLFVQETSVYMHLAFVLVEHTGRRGFLYDLLEHMISQELLPLEWLATECMQPIWSKLVRTLSDGDQRSFGNAFRYLQTAIFAGVGLPDDSVFQDGEVDVVLKQIKPSMRLDLRKALDTTFTSIFTRLVGTGLVYNAECTDKSTVQRLTWVLDYMAIGLLRRSDVRSDLELLDATTENMQTFARRALWVIAASGVVHLGGCSVAPGMVLLDTTALIRAFSWVAYQYSSQDIDVSSLLATLPGFISSAACCSRRTFQDGGLGQLQRLVNGLTSISGLRLPHKLWSMKRLTLETCMEFAQTTNEVEHFAYARQVEKMMSLDGRILLMNSPQQNDTPSAPGAFRWEEGMGEWVACTPLARQAVKTKPGIRGRPLELPPSPKPSASSQLDVERDDTCPVQDPDDSLWYEPAHPESSPIKKAPAPSPSSSGKRKRASSPRVVIPIKRTRITPPDSPMSTFDTSFDSFSSAASQPTSHTGPRRSRRTKKQITDVVKSLRTLRSRSSLNNSLRNIAPKSYADATENSENEGDKENSENEEDKENSENLWEENTEVTADNEDEGDELGKTPAGMKAKWKASVVIKVRKPASRRTRQKRGPEKKRWALAAADTGLESEDELSFQ